MAEAKKKEKAAQKQAGDETNPALSTYPDKSIAFVKAMLTLGTDPKSAEAYARKEMGDINLATQALNYISQLDEPDSGKVEAVIFGTADFIKGKIDEDYKAGKLCSDSGEIFEAQKAIKLAAAKVGARNSTADVARLKKIQELLAELMGDVQAEEDGEAAAPEVPQPGTKATADADSFEETASEIRQAFDAFVREQMPMSTFQSTNYDGMFNLPFVVETYPDYVIVCAGSEEYFKVSYSTDPTNEDCCFTFSPRAEWVPVEKLWTPMPDEAAKAGVPSDHLVPNLSGSKALKMAGRDYLPLLNITAETAIKTAGEWGVLDVLGIPFGGPINGKDVDQQYFSARTKTFFEFFKEIPVFYYHGFNPDKSQQAVPEVIGSAKYSKTDERGHWFKVTLKQASKFAQTIWDAALAGKARASSGAISHLVRVARDGEILQWATTELSLLDLAPGRNPANAYAVAQPAAKANLKIFKQAMTPQGDNQRGQAEAVVTAPDIAPTNQKSIKSGETEMDENDITNLVAAKVAEALTAKEAQDKAIKAQSEADSDRINAAVKLEREKWEKEMAASQRLPTRPGSPYATKFAEARKYDNLEARDLALMIDVLTPNKPLSENKDYAQGPRAAIKALALRLESDEAIKGESDVQGIKVSNSLLYREAIQTMKADGIKANELDNTAQSGFGSDFIGTAYSTNLWNVIRQDRSIGQRLMDSALEIPQGFSSIYLPLEGADPTWYMVGETTAKNGTTGIPDSSVPDSKVATANKQLSVGKMGARTMWSGEMDEDSLIAFAPNLRRQLEVSCLEQFTHLVIDGDTATGATTNINHIGGTPGSTDLYLLFNGFRKSPLVTTTAASRSASGSLVAEDFLATAKLLGPAGINALDQSKVSFILDANTLWKAMTLPEVKTQDVSIQATIDKGLLTGIYGYPVVVSAFMHWKSTGSGTQRRANTAGKVDQTTPANNTTGSILAVRWDQWQLGYKRRITIETQRIPAADATQIVAMMRVGMVQRDTFASAISYNVGLS